MMWAPIANNVVSIMVLLLYLIVFERTSTGAPFTTGQELLLGWVPRSSRRSAVLIPFLRASGYHFRPRFDFKNTGLGKTFRLAKWTLGFVLVTQAAFVVVTKLVAVPQLAEMAPSILHAQRVRGVDPAPFIDHSLIGHCHAAAAARRRR